MPKRKQRRQQHHLNQQPKERRSYSIGGTAPAEKYKPGFPMNLMMNTKLFFSIGAVIMIGGVIVAALLSSQNPTDNSIPTVAPTATETGTPDPNATATPTSSVSPTPARTYSQAEQVLEAGKTYTATVKTDKGEFTIDLFADKSPRTVNSFVFLAQQHFYDGLKFHTVFPNFVAKGGDPKGDGTGGPGYTFEEDTNDLKNTRGTVSMSKFDAVTTVGSQFFINLKDNPALDTDGAAQKRSYPFGTVSSGLDVVARLAQGDTIQSIEVTVK
ncbi:hypothetical protein AYO38_04025 [bacterium SCGC AG-212-C10]|nr:hypothetical protein AYO38_04025 [bacterium SCGC AG-212-C10]